MQLLIIINQGVDCMIIYKLSNVFPVKISVSVSVVMVIVLGTVIIIVGSVLLTWRRKMKKYSSLK